MSANLSANVIRKDYFSLSLCGIALVRQLKGCIDQRVFAPLSSDQILEGKANLGQQDLQLSLPCLRQRTNGYN